MQAGGIVTRHEKLAVTVRNQQLFKMLVDQQNAVLGGDEKTEVLTVQEEYSQEQISSPIPAQPIPRFGKRAREHKDKSSKKRKFKQASELGLSL